MRLVNWRTLVASAASIALAACGDDVTVVTPPPEITLNPPSVSCVAGSPTALGVTVSGGGSGTPSVTFASTGSGFTVTGSGTGATINCTAAGSGVITVTVTQNGQTVTGSVPVTVTAAPSPVLTVQVSPASATVAVDGTVQLTPIVQTTGGNTPTTVTWTSLTPSIATVDANGLVRGIAPGPATIRVSPTAAPNLVAVAQITVVPASAFVSSLTVNPTTVALQTGGTQTLASTVALAQNAPAGTSTGVTYTSSDTAVATVSSTGVITARRNGTAVITVASVAAPSVIQTVSVTVRDPLPVRLTIQSTRFVNAAGNLVPVDPANVTGPITVTLNLDPGDFQPDSVRLRLGNSVVNCQNFNTELAAAYRAALTNGSADVQSIECPISTSSFNATTGVADVMNGQQALTAEVFYRPQGAAAGSQTQRASVPQQLTINNQSGFFVQVANTPSAAQAAVNPTGQATGLQGVLWRAGSVRVTLLPVNFTTVVNPGEQSFTVSLEDANGQVATGTATRDASASTYSVSFAGTSANDRTGAPANSVTGYTSPNAGQPALAPAAGVPASGTFAGCAANALCAGTFVVVGTASGGGASVLNAAGQPNGLTARGNTIAQPIFIDNQNPEARAQTVAAAFVLSNQPTAGYFNNAVNLADAITQTATTTALGDNNGVNRVGRQFFFANNTTDVTGAANPAAAIVAVNQSATSGANNAIAIPENPVQTTYLLAARLTDALGNAVPVAVNAPAGGLFSFGVFSATPNASIAGGSAANNGRFGIAQTAALNVNFTISSPVGFGRNPSLISVRRVSPNGTFCAVGATADVTDNSVGGTADIVTGATSAATNGCPAIPAGSVSINPTSAPAGIYTITARSRDVAGNTSAELTRRFIIDRVAPAVSNPVPTTIPIRGGQTATFTAQATDNLSLVDQFALVGYSTATELLLRYNGSALGDAFATPFRTTAALSASVPNFIRSIALQPESAPGAFTNVASTAQTTVGGVAMAATDAGNNTSYGTVTGAAIGALLDQTQPGPNFFGGNGLQSVSISYVPNNTTTASTTVPAGLFGGTGSTTTPSSVTIRLTQNGVANTPFVSPFTRVEIYQRSPLPGATPFVSTDAYTLLGSFTTGGLTVTPTSSSIQSTFTFTPTFPAAGAAATTSNLLVVASDANGSAIAFIIPPITVNP